MKIRSGIVAALLVCRVGPQDVPPTSPTPTAATPSELSAYTLASALIETLAKAAAARDTLAAAKSVGDPVMDSLSGIVSHRGAINQLNEAIVLLGRFRTTPDARLRAAASELGGAYATIAARLLKRTSIWENLAKAKSVDDIAALVPESSKSAEDIQEAWRLLPLAVSAVADALVDSTRLLDGKVAYLRLTHAERATLNLDIQKRFPNIRPGDKSRHAVDVSVNLFRAFLNSVWRSSDDKQLQRLSSERPERLARADVDSALGEGWRRVAIIAKEVDRDRLQVTRRHEHGDRAELARKIHMTVARDW